MVTCTVGGTTSGYCATGSAMTATAPTTIIRIANTLASTGRAMKKSEIIGSLGRARYLPASAAAVCSFGSTF